jgi:methylase of polypeptide subunit release factors
MTWSLTAARSLIARCTQLRDDGRTEAVLRAEFQSWLRQVFPDPSDEAWVNHYSEGAEAHTRVGVAAGGIANRFIDNLIRSTVIEYEADLRQARLREHGLDQVQEYIAGEVRAGTPISQARGILSDTVEWHVFDAELAPGVTPAACIRTDVILREIAMLLPAASDDENALRLATFLKQHLAREQSRALTAENISADLGLDSLPFRRHVDVLMAMVNVGRDSNLSIALATDLWSRFVDSLERNDGTFRPAMYIDELYIAVLARLLAANVLEAHANLSDDLQLRDILNGHYFSTTFRLKNMVEDDYFGWVIDEPYLTEFMPVAREIQLDLYAYDFSHLDEPDLFGRLMAQLARRSQRKLLGQEWTPGWLAHTLAARCLDSIPDGEEPQIVDMCCGSGSILAEVLREQIRRRETATVEELSLVATGFDIDPLAVMLAKTTWVVTLASRLRTATADVIIPIYHADSLFAATPVSAEVPAPGELTDFLIDLDGIALELPARLIGPEFRGVFDDLVDWAYDEARAAVDGSGVPLTQERASTLTDALIQKHRVAADDEIRARTAATAFALAQRMIELALANRNGIWAFILRNTYRPGLLAGQFNGLVSNPPWLAMSQLADNPYKNQLSRRAQAYGINPAGASHLHLELATTYLLHAIDRYLKPNAAVACLVPGTIFNGQHHQKFRDAEYLTSSRRVAFELQEVWEVAPHTFKVRSAAVVGIKKSSTADVNFTPRGFHVSDEGRQEVSFDVRHLGTRTAWVLADNAAPLGAPVGEAVSPQGADLMPRPAVCVEIEQRNGTEWRVRTPRAASPLYFAVKDTKKLRAQTFDGFVAPRFLFRMVQSLNLLPFTCVEPFASIALPASRSASGEWHILDTAEIRTLGFRQTAQRFDRIDEALVADHVVRPLAQKINERNKLTIQRFPADHFLVLTGAGGGISCGAMLSTSEYPDIVVDQTLYWHLESTAVQAWYKVGILNSEAITEAIRPFNPQGEFGPRHLHTLPHRITPIFNPQNEDHIEIARIAEYLANAGRALITEQSSIRDPNRGISSRRMRLRNLLHQTPEFQVLEQLCAEILGTTPGGSDAE